MILNEKYLANKDLYNTSFRGGFLYTNEKYSSDQEKGDIIVEDVVDINIRFLYPNIINHLMKRKIVRYAKKPLIDLDDFLQNYDPNKEYSIAQISSVNLTYSIIDNQSLVKNYVSLLWQDVISEFGIEDIISINVDTIIVNKKIAQHIIDYLNKFEFVLQIKEIEYYFMLNAHKCLYKYKGGEIKDRLFTASDKYKYIITNQFKALRREKLINDLIELN